MRSLRYAAPLAAVVALAACNPDAGQLRSPTAPSLEMTTTGVTSTGVASDTSGGSEKRILRQGTAVAIANTTASMWAVRGRNRSMSIVYADGRPVVTFTVGGKTLVTDAAGRPLAWGDSVLITMQLVDTASFAVEMQPAGIVFSAESPAKLSFNLERADEGPVKSRQLSFWKRESRVSPWEPLPGRFNYKLRQGEVEVPGFTIYAIIY